MELSTIKCLSEFPKHLYFPLLSWLFFILNSLNNLKNHSRGGLFIVIKHSINFVDKVDICAEMLVFPARLTCPVGCIFLCTTECLQELVNLSISSLRVGTEGPRLLRTEDTQLLGAPRCPDMLQLSWSLCAGSLLLPVLISSSLRPCQWDGSSGSVVPTTVVRGHAWFLGVNLHSERRAECEGGRVRGKPLLRKQVPLKTPLRAAFPSPGSLCPGLSLRSSESAVLEGRAQLPHLPVALRLWPQHLHFRLEDIDWGMTVTSWQSCVDFTEGLPGVGSAVISGVISPGARKEQCVSPSLTDTLSTRPWDSTLQLRGRSALPQPRALTCVSTDVETAVYEKPSPPFCFMKRVLL